MRRSFPLEKPLDYVGLPRSTYYYRVSHPKRDALAGHGCTQSMSRKGNCLDNACAESFFGHLKREFSDGSDYSQPGRFIRALDSWIAWYNNGRIKESLCGMAPVEYRLAHERPT